jgi:hypothetical protein
MTSYANVESLGLLVKKESTYGTPNVPSAVTDGVQLADVPNDEEGYLYGGPRADQQAGLNKLQELPRNGRYVDLSNILLEVKGSGAAYSASVKPNCNISALMQAGGFDETVVTTGGSESVAYTPTAVTGAMASLTAELYARGEKWPLAGMYTDHVFRMKDGGPAFFEFSGRGLVSADPTAVALPAITPIQNTVLPPNCTGITFNLGSFLLGIVREIEISVKRTFNTERVNLNAASGIAGFMWGPFDPTIRMVLETTTLVGSPFHTAGGIDPYRLFKDAVNPSCAFQVGTTQYNRMKIILANGIYLTSAPKKSKNGSSALWELECAPRAISPVDTGWLKYQYD